MNKFLGAIGFALSLCLATPVNAVPIIDFRNGLAPAGGTIVDIGGGHFTGTDIPIGTLEVLAAPMGNGLHLVTGTTGATGAGRLDFDTLANTITITGGVGTLGIPDGTILLTGSFSAWSFTLFGPLGSFSGQGPDTKNEDLLTAIGLPTDLPFAFFGFSIGMANVGTPGEYTAISTDIANTAIPEPASLLLLGTGLVALSGLSRKKKARAAA